MNENEEQRAKQIDKELIKIFFACLHRWWLICICTVLTAALAFIYTANFITPMYRASVTIYVNNNRNRTNVDYVSGGDLATAQSLVSTYISMLTSDTVLEQVNEDIGGDYTAAQLRSMISAEQVEDTELFNVYVTNADPWTAAEIANSVADTAPAVIADFVEGSSTKIIDFAKVPTARSSPSWKRNTLMGAAIGAVLAIALVAVICLLDVRIKDEEELTDLLHLPILGQIPDMAQSESHRHAYAYAKYAADSEKSKKADDSGTSAPPSSAGEADKKEKTPAPAAKSGHSKPAKKKGRGKKGAVSDSIEQERRFILNAKSSFSTREAYNTLRTNINFSLADAKECRTVMVTSAMQSEGKSITAANLALSVAETKGRVLLIDCDLRRPKVSRLLKLSAPVGLSDILLDYSVLEEGTLNYRENLDVILSGRIPPNPSELLGSERMEELLRMLGEHYDYIILDTPPVGVVTDAVALASNTDGVLFVVRTGWSERGTTTRGVEHLSYGDGRILGVVMTCVPMEKMAYGGKHYRYSKYGYHRYGYSRKGYGYGGHYGKGYGYGGHYGSSYGYGGYGYGSGYGYGNGYGYGYGYGKGYGYGSPPNDEDAARWRAAAQPDEPKQ